ncbi:unnamed protein product [Paramecium sonneborni]|uniref:G domain-containing protein n=1 Tax=Paramecium sonneborni TaxID=65129 RepID=A0A8S1RE59_9CILI|nr:unnamed protein product [Paramecium sonneborni]
MQKEETIIDILSKKFTHIEKYTNQTIKLDQKIQKAIIFVGFTREMFDEFFRSEQQQVTFDQEILCPAFNKLNEKNNIIIQKIRDKKEEIYQLNFPNLFENVQEHIDDSLIILSKILLEKVILQLNKSCKFHFVINYEHFKNQLLEQQDQIIFDTLLQIGKFKFQSYELCFVIPSVNPQQVKYLFEKKQLSKMIEKPLMFKTTTYQEITNHVKNSLDFQSREEQKEPFYGYTTQLQNNWQEELLKYINNIFFSFQQKLLRWQQQENIIKVDSNKAYFKIFLQDFSFRCRQVSINFIEISKTIIQLNQIIDKYDQTLGEILKGVKNQNTFKEFLRKEKINPSDMQIEKFQIENQNLDKIINFFITYNYNDFKDLQIIELQMFQQQLFQWVQYYDLDLEFNFYEIKKVSASITQKQPLDKAVLVLGETRVGKSTFLNVLQNPENLQIGKKLDRLIYEVKKDQVSPIKIGHNLISETQFLQQLEIGQIHYFDTPGFNDTRSEFKRISDLINIYEQMRVIKQLIIMVVIDCSEPFSFINKIKAAFNPILQMLKNKKEIPNLLLVLTKMGSNIREEIINNWEELVQDQLQIQYPFIQEIYCNNKKCLSFLKPDQKEVSENPTAYFQQIQKKVQLMITEMFQDESQVQNNLDSQFQIQEELLKYYQKCYPQIQLLIKQSIVQIKCGIEKKILNSELFEHKEQIEELIKLIKEQPIINKLNMLQVLGKLKKWAQKFEDEQLIYSSLHQTIDNIEIMIQIGKYLANTENITPVSLELFQKWLEKIVFKMNTIENTIYGVMAMAVATVSPLLVESLTLSAILGVSRVLAPRLIIRYIGNMTVDRLFLLLKNYILKRLCNSMIGEEI